MKSKWIVKLSVAASLLGASALALAAGSDCCMDLDCCLQMLACCFN
ncbi:MAG: hypothetical protein JSS14_04935 [Proteobacteria bacterium]|nr:hypothetical protein [Pseudomonadota bacterium]